MERMEQICEKHGVNCILFGSSSQCSQRALVCPNTDCMNQHSLRSTNHNFYSFGDFHKIILNIQNTYHSTLTLYHNRINEVILEAIQQLEAYGKKQKQMLAEVCVKALARSAEEQRAVEKVVHAQYEGLKCCEIAYIYKEYYNKVEGKIIDYAGVEEAEGIVENTMLDICDNNGVFKFDEKRRSGMEEEEEMEMKKKVIIKYEDIENESVRVLISKWEKLELSEQEEVREAMKILPWDQDEWDLSDGMYQHLTKILTISRHVRLKQLETLKLFNNQITTLHPINTCRLENLLNLFLASNHISSIEALRQMQFPFLNKLSLYDNFIVDLRPLRKIPTPELQYLFLNNNFFLLIDAFSQINYPKMLQLSIHQNQVVSYDPILKTHYPKLSFLNMQSKTSIKNEQERNVKEGNIKQKYPFALL